MKNYTEPVMNISLFSKENIATMVSATEVDAKGQEYISLTDIQVKTEEYKNVFQFE